MQNQILLSGIKTYETLQSPTMNIQN